LFVGLRGTSKELELKSGNFWYFIDSEDINASCQAFLAKSSLDEASDGSIPLLFIAFPSAKDPTWKERYPDTSVCTVVTFGRFDWFTEWENTKVTRRGDDYELAKKAFGQRIWDQVVGIFPQLQDKVEYLEVGSPLTNNFYLGSNSGEIYGLDHRRARFEPEVCAGLRAETDIKGLYLTGQDTFTCGFGGALFGGMFSASTILKRIIFLDLLRVQRRIKERNKAKSV